MRFAIRRVHMVALVLLCMGDMLPVQLVAQSPQLEEKVMKLRQSVAANKQALAQYTWQEEETISIKGEVKDTRVYQVQMGANGQPQKTEITNDPASHGREGRLKRRIVEHMTEEYQDYGQQISALSKQYVPPDSEKLLQAYQQGNISLQFGGTAGTDSIVIKNYAKPNDSVTIVFSHAAHQVESVRIASYLNDPSDVVTIQAQFAQLPAGPNHVSGTLVDGESKHLTVSTQNSNYQLK